MNEYQHEIIKNAQNEIDKVLEENPTLLEFQTQLSKQLIGLDDESRRMLLLQAMKISMTQLTRNLKRLKSKLQEGE